MARDLDIGDLGKSFSSFLMNTGATGFQRKECLLLSQLKNRADFPTSLRVKGTGEIRTQIFLLPTTQNYCPMVYESQKRTKSEDSRVYSKS